MLFKLEMKGWFIITFFSFLFFFFTVGRFVTGFKHNARMRIFMRGMFVWSDLKLFFCIWNIFQSAQGETLCQGQTFWKSFFILIMRKCAQRHKMLILKALKAAICFLCSIYVLFRHLNGSCQVTGGCMCLIKKICLRDMKQCWETHITKSHSNTWRITIQRQ